ncbi:hypothetical protein ACSSV8_000247 [Roseovarius sp. MBR-79]|jgi:hypothetical protein
MVSVSDISEDEILKAWLEDQPREVAVWIASRAAARVLPIWWDAVLTEEWAREHGISALPVLHGLFVSSVATFVTSESLTRVTDFEVHEVHRAAYEAQPNNEAAKASAFAAAHAAQAFQSALSYAYAARSAVEAGRSASAAADVWGAVREDAEFVASGDAPDLRPLWPDGPGPLAQMWDDVKSRVAKAPDAQDWQFWIDWYDALLDGRPMLGDPARTWEMLEKIALIDPATWDKGPGVVNPVIREIWELHRLRAEVAALQAEKEAFLAARASEAHRGHNQPPEGLVDDAPDVAQSITIIWAGLDDARDELEQEEPDKGRLRAIADRMMAALRAVVAYCGKVANVGAMSAADETGKLVARTTYVATLDHFANNGRLLRFIKDLMGYGTGG